MIVQPAPPAKGAALAGSLSRVSVARAGAAAARGAVDGAIRGTLRLDRGPDGLARIRRDSGPGRDAGAGDGGAGETGAGDGSGDAALSSLFAEAEAQGAREEIVVLELHDARHPNRAGDQGWVAGALDWLAAHGRQPVLRSAVRLHREVIDAAVRAGASVELCLAHPRAELQRALLGPSASPTATLLLQSQHLRAVGLTVSARLAPLLPGIHQPGGPGTRRGQEAADRASFSSLLSHVRAADVGRVILVLGRLSRARLEAVAPHLGPAALLELAQGFGLTSGALLGLGLGGGAGYGAGPGTRRGNPRSTGPDGVVDAPDLAGLSEFGGGDCLDPHFARLLVGQLRRSAEARGLELHSSASAARVAADAAARSAGPRRYEGVVQCELFADTGA